MATAIDGMILGILICWVLEQDALSALLQSTQLTNVYQIGALQ